MMELVQKGIIQEDSSFNSSTSPAFVTERDEEDFLYKAALMSEVHILNFLLFFSLFINYFFILGYEWKISEKIACENTCKIYATLKCKNYKNYIFLVI